MALIAEVANRDVPPYMEQLAVMGPTQSPILDAMGTLEERERIEADYEWFRYSKFALPFLLFNGCLATVLLLLSLWYGGSDFTDYRNGTPRQIEAPRKTDDPEAGIPSPNKSIRISCFSIGYFGLVGLIVTMYLKPPPAMRKMLYLFFSFIGLFICGILGAISGGLDAGKIGQAVWCRSRERGTVALGPSNCYSMTKMLVALTVVDLALAGSSIITAIIVVIAALKSFAEPKDDDYTEAEPSNKGVTRSTRECILALLFVNFLLLTLMFVFTIILSEGRDIRFADEAFSVRSFNNLKPGWPLKNSRLRVSATTVVIGVTIVNLIPFRSRVFAYVCAFTGLRRTCYW